MKKGLRCLAILLAVCLLMTVTACGPQDSGDVENTTTTTNPDMSFEDTPSDGEGSQGTASGATTTKNPASDKTTTGKTSSSSGKTTTTVAVDVEDTMKEINVNGKTVTIMTHGSANSTGGKLLSSNFKKYANGKIKFMTYDFNDLAVKLQAAVLAQSPPDIYQFRNQDFPTILYKNLLEPLEDHIDMSSAVWKNVKDSMAPYVWGGKSYFIPQISVDRYIWYNKTVFTNAGVTSPDELFKANNWTWDTFKKAAEDVTDDRAGVYGFANGANLCYAALASANTDLITVTNQGITNNVMSAEVTKAMNFLSAIQTSGAVPKNSSDTAVNMFKQGKIAMLYEGSWLASSDKTLQNMIANGSVDMVMFPRMDVSSPYRSHVGISGYGIGKGTKNIECAKAFITMMALSDSLKEETVSKMHQAEKHSEAFKAIYKQANESLLVPAYSLGVSTINDVYWPAVTSLYNGTPWSTLANELKPKIDSALDYLGK